MEREGYENEKRVQLPKDNGIEYILECYFIYDTGDHDDLHVLTHSYPTRRSSDLFHICQKLQRNKSSYFFPFR